MNISQLHYILDDGLKRYVSSNEGGGGDFFSFRIVTNETILDIKKLYSGISLKGD